jgi:hypothetical protein
LKIKNGRPPWILAAILCSLNAWHADRTGERFFHITVWWWAVIVGFIISLSTLSIAGRYVSLFLMASGYVGEFSDDMFKNDFKNRMSISGFAITLVWVSNAIPRPPA